MFILGLISIFQICILPGFVLISAIKYEGNWLNKATVIFSTSLFINYLLVIVLKWVGIYHQITLIFLCLIEVVLLIIINRKSLSTPIAEKIYRGWISFKQFLEKIKIKIEDEDKNTAVVKILFTVVLIIAIIVALIRIYWFFKFSIYNLGHVFETWDAVASWNVWAKEWASPGFPSRTIFYPQLIPANWSLSYVLMGTTQIQFFAKSIMPVFSLLICLMLFDLALEKWSTGLFISIPVFFYLVKHFMTLPQVHSGYVDLPLAYMSFTSIYLLLKSKVLDSNSHIQHNILLAIIIAGGAAVTKQPGVYIILVLPLSVYFILSGKSSLFSQKSKNKKFLAVWVFIGLISAAWYVYKFIAIRSGIDESNLTYLFSEIHQNLSIFDRMIMVWKENKIYSFIFASSLLVIFWRDKSIKWITFGITIPYILFWAAFASYDTRNIAMALPLWALALGYVIDGFLDILIGILNKIRIEKLRVLHLIIVLLVLGGSAGFIFQKDDLIEAQQSAEMQILSPQINSEIKKIADNSEDGVIILTNYPVEALPIDGVSKITMPMNDFDFLIEIINQEKPDYILLHPGASDTIKQYISEKSMIGEYQLKLVIDDYVKYQLIEIVD